jgi:hypothetical protein
MIDCTGLVEWVKSELGLYPNAKVFFFVLYAHCVCCSRNFLSLKNHHCKGNTLNFRKINVSKFFKLVKLYF